MSPFSKSRLALDPPRRAALLGMADVVCVRREPGNLFHELDCNLRSTLPFDLINFARYDPARKLMQMSLWEGLDSQCETLELSEAETAVGRVWRSQTVLSLNNLPAERRFEAELRWLRACDLCSYCVVPLTNFREKVGALGFGRKRIRPFVHKDLDFLHQAAEMVALSLDKTIDEPT